MATKDLRINRQIWAREVLVIDENGVQSFEWRNPLEIVGIVVSYAAIIGAFVFDMVKIRPIRNYYRSKAEGMSERKIAEVLAAASSKGSKDSAKDAAEAAEGSANTTVESAKKPKKNQRSRR